MARLPAEWVEHLNGGVSHRLGSSHADGRPELIRGVAARMLEDGHIEVLLCPQFGAQLLQAVAATRHIALVASSPARQRTLHMKGRDAARFAPEPSWRPDYERCRDRYTEQIVALGFPREHVMSRLYATPFEQLAGLRFSLCGAWDQTPGPGAGQVVDLLP
jgi:hypothetical protein